MLGKHITNSLKLITSSWPSTAVSTSLSTASSGLSARFILDEEILKCLPVSVTNSRECWVVWSGACWEGQTWQENIRIHSHTGYMTRSIENMWNRAWAPNCSPPMSWGRCQHHLCWPQGNNNKCSKNNSNIWIYINMNRHPTFSQLTGDFWEFRGLGMTKYKLK